MNEEVMKRLGTLSEQERRQLLAQLLDKKIAKPKTAPLSFAQQRLWFINQLYPGDAAYNMFSATHLRGPLNVVALEQSFQRVVQRHESLRTTFQSAEGEPRQVIATTMHVGLTLNDLSSRPSTPEAEIETQRLMREEAI